MYTVKIRSSLKAGWSAFTRRPWYLMGIMLSFMTLFALSIGNAVITALAYIVYGGYIALMLNHFRGGKVKFDDIFSIDNRWISFAFLGLIKTILIMFGFIFFIIPGIYLAIRWMFAEILVIDKNMKPMEALKASSVMVEGHYWKLFLFLLVTIFLMIIGTLALIVGFVPAALVILFTTIAIYENLKGALEPAPAPVAPETPQVV